MTMRTMVKGTCSTKRGLPALALALLAVNAPGASGVAVAQEPEAAPEAPSGAEVFTIADSLVGAVGGVAVDRLGVIYVADFGETVYKVQPDGRVAVLATGLYGTSGNAIGSHGELYQANFSGDYISRIERDGSHSIFADGLDGPVGVAVGPDGELYVNNCRGNSVDRISPEGEVRELAASELFNCPNGIVRHPDGDLYVVNFSDGRMLRVTADGETTEFARVPGGGNGHVVFVQGSFYVTAFQTHRIYRVTPAGDVSLFAGTGTRGEVDGPADEAQFSWPNGIAAAPTGDRVYVNDYLNRTPPTATHRPVPRSSLRMVKLASVSQRMLAALRASGIDAMVEAYREFKEAPATAGVFTETELNALGYRLMNSGQLEAATRVFELNVESYPNSWNVYDSLAEAHMNAGDHERAMELYERSLEINPGNANATRMIERIRAEQ